MKYDKSGETMGEFILPDAIVPHSIVLDDCSDTLFVADRENDVIRLVNAFDGTENPQSPVDLKTFGKVYSLTKDEYNNIYALTWDRGISENVHVVQLQKEAGSSPYFPKFDLVGVRLPDIRFPHDFSVSYNFAEHSLHIIVGETGPGASGKMTEFIFGLL